MTAPETTALASDDVHMARAIAAAGRARTLAPPNPWVGAVVVTADGRAFEGATSAPGGGHAEIVAMEGAVAATLDGRAAAPGGTSQVIPGSEARTDAHRLRAESDAVIIGAGTVKADDP